MLQYCPNLTHLHCNNCPNLYDLDVADAIGAANFISRLECFYIYEAPHLTVNAFQILLEGKVECSGKRLRVCFEHLRNLNFASDVSVCCGACMYTLCRRRSKYRLAGSDSAHYIALTLPKFRPNFKHENGNFIFLPSQQLFLRSVNAARNSKASNVRNRPWVLFPSIHLLVILRFFFLYRYRTGNFFTGYR
jgi:hypothetical protein